jgi:hypothetical protein
MAEINTRIKMTDTTVAQNYNSGEDLKHMLSGDTTFNLE